MNTFLNILRSLVVVSVMLSGLIYGQEKEIAQGKAALQSGDLTKAIEMFRKATQEDKKNVEAHILLAQALFQADSLNALTIEIVLIKDLDPNNAAINILQGDAWMKQKLTVPAITEYMKAAELDPKNLDVWVKLAEAQRKARQYNEAAKTYQTILTLDSMNITALSGLGTMYYRAKQFAPALPYIEKLAMKMTDSVDIQVKYVKCLSETNRDSVLLPIAEALVAKDASLTETQEILDKAYVKLKMNRKIIDLPKNKNPESLSIDELVRYVKALQSEQVNDTAETIYQIIFKKDSSRCDLRYYFGTNEMKLKKYAEAVRQFEKKIECDTSAGYRFASHLNAAMSLMQLKKFKDALDHTKKAIEYRPDNVQAWTMVAECYGQLEQIDDEISTYKKVIDLATGNGDEGKYDVYVQEAYRMIGVRRLIVATKITDAEKNRPIYAEAAKYLVKAIQLKPSDCEALLWTAQAFQNSNNKDEAKKYYRRFIDQCPKDKKIEEVKKNLQLLGN